MRRGEEKELEATPPYPLFLTGTSRFQNGNQPAPLLASARHNFVHPLSEILHLLLLGFGFGCLLSTMSCGGGASSSFSPTPPPPSISVNVTPASATVLLGNSVDFIATVSGTSNTAINWAVNGIPGGNSSMGAISSTGIYQAPAILPAQANMQIVATSQADVSSSARATVTVSSDVSVQLAPATVSVAPGATQSFTAAISSSGHPASTVSWSVSGAGCSGSACGTISFAGLYTAPAAAPQPPQVTVSATSVADPSKSATAVATISGGAHTIAVTPANATVPLEQTQGFAATLDGSSTEAVTWSVNGIAGGNTTVGTISNSPSMNGLYLAPVNMPAARSVTISAASTAHPALSASVTLQLTSNVAVSINPTASTRIPGARQTFTASVTQTSNPQVSWTVNGVLNGNSTSGQICVVGSNPCLSPPAISPSGSVDYLAPSVAPSPPQIFVAAVSAADPGRSASATVTITPQITVSISPSTLTLPPQQVQLLTATVLGVADQRVSWDVDGSPNGSIPEGLICLPASSPCQAPGGAVAGPVEFRAPSALPSPNIVQVRATTTALPAAQAILPVAISSAPFITGLVPASVFAGAQNSFGLRVAGVLFAASQPGPGSSILVNGSPRPTICPSAAECDTVLDASDVAIPSILTVSLRNADGTSSNSVRLLVAAPQSSESSIALDSASPVASGIDVTVVEPTLAGSSPPGQITLLELGLMDPTANACVLGAPPLLVSRPPSGVSTVHVCVFGASLDQVAQVIFSSPASPDISAANLDTSGGSLLLEFDLLIPSTAVPGARTLFVSTSNLDSAALTAALEVQ